MLVFTWFFLAYKILGRSGSVKNPYNSILVILVLTSTFTWLIGIEISSYIGFNVSWLGGLGYGVIVYLLSKTLIEEEGNTKLGFEFFKAFIMAFFLPIGVWWLQPRVCKIQRINGTF